MLIITSDTISGRKYQELGIAQGNTVQTVHLGKDIMAGFKTLVGGELTSYNEMMKKARNLAEERMIQNAEQMGADAIICMRYASNSITQGAAEILAYGTAVKFIDE